MSTQKTFVGYTVLERLKLIYSGFSGDTHLVEKIIVGELFDVWTVRVINQGNWFKVALSLDSLACLLLLGDHLCLGLRVQVTAEKPVVLIENFLPLFSGNIHVVGERGLTNLVLASGVVADECVLVVTDD